MDGTNWTAIGVVAAIFFGLCTQGLTIAYGVGRAFAKVRADFKTDHATARAEVLAIRTELLTTIAEDEASLEKHQTQDREEFRAVRSELAAARSEVLKAVNDAREEARTRGHDLSNKVQAIGDETDKRFINREEFSARMTSLETRVDGIGNALADAMRRLDTRIDQVLARGPAVVTIPQIAPPAGGT